MATFYQGPKYMFFNTYEIDKMSHTFAKFEVSYTGACFTIPENHSLWKIYGQKTKNPARDILTYTVLEADEHDTVEYVLGETALSLFIYLTGFSIGPHRWFISFAGKKT